MSVFDALVGQPMAAHELAVAVWDAELVLDGQAGPAMTHAWLFVGPPGSGRSVAARAFAQALQCKNGGCGTCQDCLDVVNHTHPDVVITEPIGVHYGVEDVREIVAQASGAPLRGRWRVFILEDADRLESQQMDWKPANVLLKAIEEPAPHTVWILCAPSLQDVIPTIKSRCRVVSLRTPTVQEVTDVLIEKYDADPTLAATAARLSQGHIGQARRYIRDEDMRARHLAVMNLPSSLVTLDACISAAANFVEGAEEHMKGATKGRDSAERDDVRQVYGVGARGIEVRGASKALSDLEKTQKKRARRVRSDAVDLALLDLLAFYRDVLMVQWGADVGLINSEFEDQLREAAASSTPEVTMRRLEEVLRTREVLSGNAVPKMVLEALFATLKDPVAVR
ncbi:MAG: DNA polymerase III subunit delta' [Actinomycetes bacterium]